MKYITLLPIISLFSFNLFADTHGLENFSIDNYHYLGLGKTTEYSVTYRANAEADELFFEFQQVFNESNVPLNGMESFVMDNYHFLLVSSTSASETSGLYRWNPSIERFEIFQTFSPRGDTTWDYFMSTDEEGNSHAYLINGARLPNEPVIIYKYNGNQFALYQEIDVYTVTDIQPIQNGKDISLFITYYDFLGSNVYGQKIYNWNTSEQKFIGQHQTSGDMAVASIYYFTLDNQPMLALMEFNDYRANRPPRKGKIYTWNKGMLKLFQEFSVEEGTVFLHMLIGKENYLFIGGKHGDLFRYSSKDQRFVFEQNIMFDSPVYSSTSLNHNGNVYLAAGGRAADLNSTLIFKFNPILERFEYQQALI
jgi:hypothetical protein